MIELFVSAFALGFLFNAAPGAIFAESLRRGMVGGFAQAFAVQVGSLIGDLIWAVLGLLGAAAIFTLPLVAQPMAVLGAALLGWMAWQSLRDAIRPMPCLMSSGVQSRKSAFAAGAGLSLSNPMNIPYWAAFFVFIAGFMASSFLWCFVCAAGIGWTRHYVSPVIWRVLNLTCAGGLLFFALLTLSRLIGV